MSLRIAARTALAVPVFAVSIWAFPQPVRGQCELAAVTGSDAQLHDNFGASVAVDGDFAVIGAPGTDSHGRDFVPSYVFRRVGSTWVEDTILAPTNISPRARFGISVAIDDDLIVVGASLDGHSEDTLYDGPGATYVYRFDGQSWNEETKLVGTYQSHFGLGLSVATSDGRIFSRVFDTTLGDGGKGLIYVYQRDGPQWTRVATLLASDGTSLDYFGSAIAVDGSVAVVGAPNSGHTDDTSFDGTGAVYVFRFDGVVWFEEAKLTVPNVPEDTWFGGAVSIDNDVVLVGAPTSDTAGYNAGEAYVFRHVGDKWVLESSLLGNDIDALDRFGRSVSIRGDLAVVGAHNVLNGRGAAYLFLWDGNTWNQVAKLTASDATPAQSWFGYSVAQDEDIAVVGAKISDQVATNSGSAYFFRVRGEPDCNANTVNDACEPDCNENGIPDDCDIASGTSDDCNGNDVPDDCDFDCNDNGVPDDCDIASGTSDDCNSNDVPDDCDFDCNENGVPDDCDIASGTSDDCNSNDVPDDCELDCNGNQIADDCDIDAGYSDDCNDNGIPDECEPDCNQNDIEDSCDIDAGFSLDCNWNDIPDECEPAKDCNGNGIQDICDIANGTSCDGNENNTLDECELADGLLIRMDVPGLVGGYAGATGSWHETEFDFGRGFWMVRGAWLRVTANSFLGPAPVAAFGGLDGLWADPVIRAADPDRPFCVPLEVTPSALDGAGVVGLLFNVLVCCDWPVEVTDATLWFDASPLVASMILGDFARFQQCFGKGHIAATSLCKRFDFDDNADIDLDDYAIFCRCPRADGATNGQ